MLTPTISIISSAARPENWQGLYENIGSNHVSCEYVFVGPNAPKWNLPENFKYIKSNVKPSQCFEIAARHASGELLLWMMDDCLYTTDKPLDKLYELYLQQDNPKVIISSNYALPDGWDRFFIGDMDSPRLALCGLLPARLWSELGGIDKIFIALCWAEDIAMNVLSIGGEVIMSDVFMDEEVEKAGKPRSRGSTLLKDHYSTDRALLERLWSTEGIVHFERAEPVQPFSNDNIMRISQHPQGRWKNDSDIANKIITSRLYYLTKNTYRNIRGRLHRFGFATISSRISRILTK